MTYRVILQRLAIEDLDDAFAWAASDPRHPDPLTIQKPSQITS